MYVLCRARPACSRPATAMQNQPFDLKVEADEGLHRIILSGELDLHTSLDLSHAVKEVCSNRAQEVEIDLRGVRFIDSTGIRTLLVVASETASRGVTLRLIPSNSPHVTNVFEVTQMLDTLPWRARAAD